MALALVTTCILVLLAAADPLPGSSPHTYPGKPHGDYSPLWQNYFHVNQNLPNVTSSAHGPRTFAGNIAVQRAGHPNNTLFFVGVENTLGSLTKPAKPVQNDPWGIFLNGGPGSSTMLGFFFENGPIHIQGDYSAVQNKYSWDKLADWFWIDQPVGVGYSTVDSNGYAPDEDQVATDFMGFLGNLVKVFPSLASRPLHLSGESYAGTYIPYIMKAYFSMTNPPVKIAKVVLGNPTISDAQSFGVSTVMSVIETWPQFIGYDQDVYNYFKEQSHLCGCDVNLTYPQNGVIPPLKEIHPTGRVFPPAGDSQAARLKFNQLARRSYPTENLLVKRDRDNAQALWKKDLSGRGNGTIDSWYGCFLYDELLDYAINFTYPWNDILVLDVYNVPDALNPEVNLDASVFLNDNRTRTALHAPDIEWSPFSPFPFGSPIDPSPVPMTFFNEFAKNASTHNIGVVLYSGNDDSLIPHRGTEIAIQNTTFGGIQGFTRKPSTPWTNDDGQFAGIVHQERNWTYVLFNNAAHQVPMSQPISAYTFLRDFVLGKKTTGLVQTSGGKTTVIGGEDSTLAPILRGGDEIYLGSGTTQSTYFYPTATRAAWESFIRTATATSLPTRTPRSAKFALNAT